MNLPTGMAPRKRLVGECKVALLRLCNFALPRAPRRRNVIENRVPPTEVNA